ncbi:hypothetical protein OG871_40325 (plasmid) [Kitasatospora sp. NBC_00374]|uniref:hypothetical protein n=1 Tax=Kitasatospora sp. NBC_00374 TaxID=2975964 RepID=UPI00324E11CA
MEPNVVFRGRPVASVSDGRRSLLVTVLPEGAAIAPWPSVGDRFEEVPGTDGLPARLADAAVRRHLPALDSALARRMTVEQGETVVAGYLRDLAAAVPGHLVRPGSGGRLVLDLPSGRLVAEVDPRSMEVTLLVGIAGLAAAGPPAGVGPDLTVGGIAALARALRGLDPGQSVVEGGPERVLPARCGLDLAIMTIALLAGAGASGPDLATS